MEIFWLCYLLIQIDNLTLFLNIQFGKFQPRYSKDIVHMFSSSIWTGKCGNGKHNHLADNFTPRFWPLSMFVVLNLFGNVECTNYEQDITIFLKILDSISFSYRHTCDSSVELREQFDNFHQSRIKRLFKSDYNLCSSGQHATFLNPSLSILTSR